MPKVIEDQTIFQAVIQTITQRGYAGATTRQMADAAKVSEVTLFRKYGNKQQLVKRAIAALVDESDFPLATHYTGDMRADLLRVLTAYQNSAVMNMPFFAVLFSEMAHHPELVESFDQPLSLFRAVGDLLARYQTESCLRPENPSFSVSALLGPMVYSTMMRSVIPDNQLPPFDLQSHLNFFLEGRADRPAEFDRAD